MHANTQTVEDVINTLDTDQRFGPMIKLKGFVAFKAMTLASQYMMKTAKIIADQDKNDDVKNIDKFNAAMAIIRSQPDEDALMAQMGLEVNTGMWSTVQKLIGYANKLNYDCQDLLDPRSDQWPEGEKRTKEGAKWVPGYGVTNSEGQRRKNMLESLAFRKENDEATDTTETYESFLQANPAGTDFYLTVEEWSESQVAPDTFFTDHGHTVVDLLMDIGTEEADFDDLPERVQISCIEAMRKKIPAMADKARERVNKRRDLTRTERTLESAKIKGLILGMDKQFTDMLDAPRYINFREFMFNYNPEGQVENEIRSSNERQAAAAARSAERRRNAALHEQAERDAEAKAEAEKLAALKVMVVKPEPKNKRKQLATA